MNHPRGNTLRRSDMGVGYSRPRAPILAAWFVATKPGRGAVVSSAQTGVPPTLVWVLRDISYRVVSLVSAAFEPRPALEVITGGTVVGAKPTPAHQDHIDRQEQRPQPGPLGRVGGFVIEDLWQA